MAANIAPITTKQIARSAHLIENHVVIAVQGVGSAGVEGGGFKHSTDEFDGLCAPGRNEVVAQRNDLGVTLGTLDEGCHDLTDDPVEQFPSKRHEFCDQVGPEVPGDRCVMLRPEVAAVCEEHAEVDIDDHLANLCGPLIYARQCLGRAPFDAAIEHLVDAHLSPPTTSPLVSEGES